jgi:hypothetical protein
MKNKTILDGLLENEKAIPKKTTIKLSYSVTKTKQNVKKIPTVLIICDEHSVKVKPWLDEFNCPLLLVIRNTYLQTEIDMIGISNHALFSFESDGKFIGASLIGINVDAPLQFFNTSKLILIAPKDLKLSSLLILNINY